MFIKVLTIKHPDARMYTNICSCYGVFFMYIEEKKTIYEKLDILSAAAKYDVACTSSGVDKRGNGKSIGNSHKSGICHSFSSDGRCISLLKILMTNYCVYNCKYCINRVSNDVERVILSPDEICELTIEFYRRNYIEGLFLSSGIVKSPDITMELLYETLYKLRNKYNFNGYIHVKAIPGADSALIEKTGFLADRMSVNLELPTAEALKKLAPNKNRKNILTPMRQIQLQRQANKEEITIYKKAPKFVPAGQSTQMIIGAGNETDYELLKVTEALYGKFSLKRVFFSAFINVNNDTSLPATLSGPPLLREHRLYQADWLMRFYEFEADEILNNNNPNFNVFLDPKCDWALRNMNLYPVEINTADYHDLLRIPGVGVKSAGRIVMARRFGNLNFEDLKAIGIVMKRAKYFMTCEGRLYDGVVFNEDLIVAKLMESAQNNTGLRKNSAPINCISDNKIYKQMSIFDYASNT